MCANFKMARNFINWHDFIFTSVYCISWKTMNLWRHDVFYVQLYYKLDSKSCASAGSRTRVDCLEGNHANRYTTDAVIRALCLKSNSLYSTKFVHEMISVSHLAFSIQEWTIISIVYQRFQKNCLFLTFKNLVIFSHNLEVEFMVLK